MIWYIYYIIYIFSIELNKTSKEWLLDCVNIRILFFVPKLFSRLNKAIVSINHYYIFFFSFDVRGRAFTKALYWSDTNAFGPRAYFLTLSKPATLSVDNVQLDDEGVSINLISVMHLINYNKTFFIKVYRCRVDFQNSPTRNHRINLTVIGELMLFFNSIKTFLWNLWKIETLNGFWVKIIKQ